MRKADMVVPSSSGSDREDAEAIPGLSGTGICYSLEIKDTVIPPWIVSGLCLAMSSDFRSFESTYVRNSNTLSRHHIFNKQSILNYTFHIQMCGTIAK